MLQPLSQSLIKWRTVEDSHRVNYTLAFEDVTAVFPFFFI